MGHIWQPVFEVHQLIAQFNINNFVETGCADGSALRYMLPSGINLYSCDINPAMASQCQREFTEAEIIATNSLDFFDIINKKIEGPCLFWLDAHFPEYHGFKMDTTEFDLPLYAELLKIKEKAHYEKDVIIMDDIRVIDSPDNPRFIRGEIDGIVPLEKRSLQAFIDVFVDTHNYHLYHEDQGYLVFTPKINEVLK